MNCTAIVLAAGQGKRMKSKIQKQFLLLKGKPVLFYSISCFEKSSEIDDIIIVTGAESVEYVKREIVEPFGFQKVKAVVTGGKERYDSVYEGLKACQNCDYVFIHDGARPFVTEEMIERGVVFILETNQDKDYGSLENVKNVLGGKNGDFVTAVDEKSIIIVKELSESDSYPQVDKIANTILTTLGVEKDSNTHIAYGTIVKELKEVSRSYKEARMALDVGKIFFGEKEVIAYSSLGIGRLIYQLPIPLCKMFIREIFDSKSPDDFDEETLTTINKFFENSLNVSETSRQLYIHRNTLVYRLDKLQKSTGLDLRVFEDAITFKIALMVVKYMKYMETLDY